MWMSERVRLLFCSSPLSNDEYIGLITGCVGVALNPYRTWSCREILARIHDTIPPRITAIPYWLWKAYIICDYRPRKGIFPFYRVDCFAWCWLQLYNHKLYTLSIARIESGHCTGLHCIMYACKYLSAAPGPVWIQSYSHTTSNQPYISISAQSWGTQK